MEVSQAIISVMSIHCKDAQVAQGGSQGVFLSVTQCSLVHAGVKGHS